MNSLQLITKIKSRMAEMAELGDEILSQNKSLFDIEKEILKRNCIELYELLMKLKTDDEQQTEAITQKEIQKQEEIDTQEHINTNNKVLITYDEMPKSLPKHFTSFIDSANEEKTLNAIAENIIEEEDNVEQEVKTMQPVMEHKIEYHNPLDSKPELKIGRTVMPDFTKEETKIIPPATIDKTENDMRFNEKIALNKDRYQIPDKSFEPKIDNLKAAITLNKKIAFVNDLFKENVVDYAKSIDKINNAIDINEAMLYFNELKNQYNWQGTNELVVDLEKLIKRRF